jgi:hypothetical protein
MKNSKNQNAKKLVLGKQTMINLNDRSLSGVVGGTFVTISLCNEFSGCGCRTPLPKLE